MATEGGGMLVQTSWIVQLVLTWPQKDPPTENQSLWPHGLHGLRRTPPRKSMASGPRGPPCEGPPQRTLPESVSPPSELIQHQPFLQVQLALPLHCEVWPQPVRGLPCKAGGSGGTLFTVLSSASSQSGSALLVGLWDHPSTLPRSGCWASVKPVGTRTLGV